MLATLLPLAPIGLALFLLAMKFWRTAIVAIFFWLLLEGAVRKWVFPQFQAPVLLMKDFVLLAAYVGYVLAPKVQVAKDHELGTVQLLFGITAIYCVLEVLNPNLPSVFLGLYGLKNYLMYLPLIFIIPELCTTRAAITKVVFWSLVSSIPVCLLGLYQFTQPPASWVNTYVSHETGVEAQVMLFGTSGEGEFRYGRARTASTFSFLSGFTTYLIFALPLAISRLLSTDERRETLFAAVVFAVAAGATLTTGSRTPVVVVGAMVPLMVLIAGAKNLLPFGVALRLAALAILAIAASMWLFSDAATAFLYRAENADSTSGRLFSPVEQIIDAFRTSPLFGLGVGSNSNAAATLGGSDFYWLGGNIYETEPSRVLQDLGLAGFLLIYFTKIYVMYLAGKYLLWSRSRTFIAVHLTALAYTIPHFVLFTINNPTGAIIYWGLLGLSVAAHRVEHRERSAMAQARFVPARDPRPAEIAVA